MLTMNEHQTVRAIYDEIDVIVGKAGVFAVLAALTTLADNLSEHNRTADPRRSARWNTVAETLERAANSPAVRKLSERP